MSKTDIRSLGLAIASLCIGAFLRADVIETKDGSRIVGHLTKIDAGSVTITTSYAGDITIKQSEITTISTDKPVSVRLDTGARIDGVVSTQNGMVQIAGPDGSIVTTIPKVTQSWPVGTLDPAAGHWVYESTVDISGTSGNKTELGTDIGFSAKRISPQDELDFYTAYNRQVAEGEVSTDQFKAGIDYSNDFTATSSWFVRDEAGFDRVLAIDFYETAAAGIGEALIKNNVDLLTARVGLAYRYDSYVSPPVTPAVSAVAADFELNNDLKTATWELVDKLVVLPDLSAFGNDMITQDSYFQIPLKSPAWKFRVGVSNNYISEPPAGIKKLDTNYYARLILDWGE